MCDGVGGSILNPYDRPGVAPPIMLIGSLAVYLLKVSSSSLRAPLKQLPCHALCTGGPSRVERRILVPYIIAYVTLL